MYIKISAAVILLVSLGACVNPQDLGGISRIKYDVDTKAFLYEGGKEFGEIEAEVIRHPDGRVTAKMRVVGVKAFEGQKIQQQRLIEEINAWKAILPGIVEGATKAALCAAGFVASCL